MLYTYIKRDTNYDVPLLVHPLMLPPQKIVDDFIMMVAKEYIKKNNISMPDMDKLTIISWEYKRLTKKKGYCDVIDDNQPAIVTAQLYFGAVIVTLPLVLSEEYNTQLVGLINATNKVS